MYHSNTVKLQSCLAHVSKSQGHKIKGPIDIKMGLDARKMDFGPCEQQRRRPVFASTQSDQRLYYSLIGKYNI